MGPGYDRQTAKDTKQRLCDDTVLVAATTPPPHPGMLANRYLSCWLARSSGMYQRQSSSQQPAATGISDYHYFRGLLGCLDKKRLPSIVCAWPRRRRRRPVINKRKFSGDYLAYIRISHVGSLRVQEMRQCLCNWSIECMLFGADLSLIK